MRGARVAPGIGTASVLGEFVVVIGRVYSYLRFSDPRQAAGHSLDRQAAYAARWAAEHGLALDESLSLKDEGLSAYHQRHVTSGALGVFLAAVQGGQVPPGSVLVVEALDRLSRAEPIQAQAQLAQIVNAGITVVTASDGKSYSRETLKANPMDLVYSLLVMIRAHEESDTKSKRVSASIRKLCEGWLAGTYRGLIRNGKDPQWLRLDESGQWQIIPERAEAVRLVVEMYSRGYGAAPIVQELHKRGLRPTDMEVRQDHIYRLIKVRALTGHKELTVGDQTYLLAGYYPALISQAQWDEMRETASTRTRAKVRGPLPSILTGHGITTCGYCGGAMASQTMTSRVATSKTGKIQTGNMRIRCVQAIQPIAGLKCMGGGSCTSVTVERAIINFCSDMLNLRSLYGQDRQEGPRDKLAEVRSQIAAQQKKLDRITNAIMEASDEGVPASFARTARQLEDELDKLKEQETLAEAALAAAYRKNLDGSDDAWRQIAAGVEAQDYDARMRARQLVRDTFSQIVVYWKGVVPDETPAKCVDLILVAKGGEARPLRVDRHGKWSTSDSVTAIPPDSIDYP